MYRRTLLKDSGIAISAKPRMPWMPFASTTGIVPVTNNGTASTMIPMPKSQDIATVQSAQGVLSRKKIVRISGIAAPVQSTTRKRLCVPQVIRSAGIVRRVRKSKTSKPTVRTSGVAAVAINATR
jgi:hypothetical protein